MSWREGATRLLVGSKFRGRERVTCAGFFLEGGSTMRGLGIFRLAKPGGFIEPETSAFKKLNSVSQIWKSAALMGKYWEKGGFDRGVIQRTIWGNKRLGLFLGIARDTKGEWGGIERIFSVGNENVELKLSQNVQNGRSSVQNVEVSTDREKEGPDSNPVGDNRPSDQQERALVELPSGKEVKELSRGWIRWRFIYLTITYLINAMAIYYLYSQVFPEDRLVGTLAYGLELMRSIPLLDLAQMSRLWIALPIACILLDVLSARRFVPRHFMKFANISYLVFYFYRNYEILFHMGHFTWTLLILMSLRMTSWFVLIELGLNAPQFYKSYPIRQYDPAHLKEETTKVLDKYREDPGSIPEHGSWMVRFVLFITAIWSYGVFGVENAGKAVDRIKGMAGWNEKDEEK